MSDTELAVIWGAVSIAGFVVAGLGLVEGLYLGIAAAIAVALVFVAPAYVSFVVFVVLIALAIPITRLALKRTRYYDDASSRSGAARLVGQIGVITAPIADSATPGRVRVQGLEMPAGITFDHHGPVHLGTRVVIDRLDDSVLIVAPQAALRERYARGEISYDELERLMEEEPT